VTDPPQHETRDRGARAAFVAAVVVNLVALYWPRTVSGEGLFPGVDKVVHIGVFAAVALTGVRIRLPLLWLVAALVGNALVSELVQHWLLPDRSGDPADVLADVVGIGLGAALGVATARVGGSWRHDRAGRRDRADRAAAGRDAGAR
jgi:hypothetical protein